MRKIAIFVDVQNIYYTTKQRYQRNFDYNKFWNRITTNKDVVAATAYATTKGDKKQTEFQNILRAVGFEVKLKPYISRSDGSSKGDWDVGITIDILKCSEAVDTVILASGDGDFDLLLKEIRETNTTESEVFGVKDLTAQTLINECTHFHEIGSDLLL
jgi:uncharacterized LabA/DUF88 family protein